MHRHQGVDWCWLQGRLGNALLDALLDWVVVMGKGYHLTLVIDPLVIDLMVLHNLRVLLHVLVLLRHLVLALRHNWLLRMSHRLKRNLLMLLGLRLLSLLSRLGLLLLLLLLMLLN